MWLLRPHPESCVRSGVEEYRDLIMENYILHSGVIIRATAYAAVGGYDPSVRYACDTLMWLMLCGQGKAAYCADELYAYRWHESNMSDSWGGIRVGMKEHVDAIKKTFITMRGSPGITQDMYVRAIKKNISAIALGKIFNGHVGLAWYVLWCGVQIQPMWTICQRSTLIMFAYTLLGPRRYQAVRSLFRPGQESIAPA